jgi:hypothetical protein
MSNEETYTGEKITLPRPIIFGEILDLINHLSGLSKGWELRYEIQGRTFGNKPRQKLEISLDAWDEKEQPLGKALNYIGFSNDAKTYPELTPSFTMANVPHAEDSNSYLKNMLDKETAKLLAYFARD